MHSISQHGLREKCGPCNRIKARGRSAWKLTYLTGVFCAICFPFAAQNQQETGTAPIIKTTVRQVLVPVVVTDKKGHPVSNLQQPDFTVWEDGVPQHIVAFRKTYDALLEQFAHSPAASSAAAPIAAVPPARAGSESPTRTYLVCVDTLHSSFGNVNGARRALTKFFQQEHDSKAQYALMNLSRQIEVIQDSTRDPSLVLSALASKKFQSSILDGEASNIEGTSEQLRRLLLGFSPQACRNSDSNVQGIPYNCFSMKQRVRLFINGSAERTSLLTRAFLQELKTVVNAMADMPTERTLILISDGFNLVPGRELYGIASAYFPDDPEWRFQERDTQPQLDELLRLAQRRNVIVYALDSRGVYTPTSTGVSNAANQGDAYWTSGHAMDEMMQNETTIAWENGSAMAQLAAATGGLYFHDNNNLLAGLQRAFDDGRERYMIAYSPSNDSANGKYRKIRVEVKDKNLRVHAKAGYWATGN
jgi:VWFA-related protein